MITEKTYSISDAKYAAKKLLKSFKNRELESPRINDYLTTLVIFSENSNMPKLKKRTQKVIDYLMMPEGSFEEMLITVSKICEQLSAANEKRRVMEVRERSSSRYFKKQIAEVDKSFCPTQLNVYDIVKVPTMGGMHYSIITDINNDFVTCHPMTTASRKDLGLIGSKSVSLSGCGDRKYEGIRITSSATKIPLNDALKSYYGSVADNPQICEKVVKMLSISSH